VRPETQIKVQTQTEPPYRRDPPPTFHRPHAPHDAALGSLPSISHVRSAPAPTSVSAMGPTAPRNPPSPISRDAQLAKHARSLRLHTFPHASQPTTHASHPPQQHDSGNCVVQQRAASHAYAYAWRLTRWAAQQQGCAALQTQSEAHHSFRRAVLQTILHGLVS